MESTVEKNLTAVRGRLATKAAVFKSTATTSTPPAPPPPINRSIALSKENDQDLMKMSQGGDQEAYAVIYQR
jgi:hypothetical protein